MFLTTLKADSFYFEAFLFPQFGHYTDLDAKSKNKNAKEIDMTIAGEAGKAYQHNTGFMLGFGGNVGYRFDFDNGWFIMWNILGGQFAFGIPKAGENQSIDITLPSQFKVGKFFKDRYSAYLIFNPLHLRYAGMINKQITRAENTLTPTGATAGLGCSIRLSNTWSMFGEFQITQDYKYTGSLAAKIHDLPFSFKPFHYRLLIGAQMSKRPSCAL